MSEQTKLLSLTSDFVFCALFSQSPDSLIDLLNAALAFEGEARIKEIAIQDSRILKQSKSDKLSILDIKAQSISGDLYNVEMAVCSMQTALRPP